MAVAAEARSGAAGGETGAGASQAAAEGVEGVEGPLRASTVIINHHIAASDELNMACSVFNQSLDPLSMLEHSASNSAGAVLSQEMPVRLNVSLQHGGSLGDSSRGVMRPSCC